MQFERTNKKDFGAITDGKDSYVIEVAFTETPKPKRQIQILQSPFFCEVQKDLFSQLLGSDTKAHTSPMMLLGWTNNKSDCEGSYLKQNQFEFESMMDEEELSEQIDDQNQDQLVLDAKQDQFRKRRRKSTAQIKVLKQQFDKRQGEWSKQKIVKMAQLTGLSESQVYKWCWDQKKKYHPCSKVSRTVNNLQSQNEDESKQQSQLSRTKFIHKRKEYDSMRNQTLRKRN